MFWESSHPHSGSSSIRSPPPILVWCVSNSRFLDPERRLFSEIATLSSLMSRFGACSARISGDRHTHTHTHTQTHTQTHRTTTVTLVAHARRGLIRSPPPILVCANVGVLQVFTTVKQVQSHPFHARQLQWAPWFHHLHQASQNCSVHRTIWRLFSVWRLCKVRYSLVASYRYTEYFCAGIALSWLLNPFVLEYS